MLQELQYLLLATIALSTLPQSSSQVIINEFVASNGTTMLDEDGDAEDWIELLNLGPQTVNLAGYGLTDDPDTPFRWVFPDTQIEAHSRLIVWASGKNRTDTLHANFSISAEGEPLLLSGPDGAILDSVTAVSLPRDTSYGRKPDGTGPWRMFSTPTPGTPNTTEAFLGQAASPVLNRDPGFYTQSVQVDLAVPVQPGVQIRYTYDGSEPTASSPIFSGPIMLQSRAGDPNYFSTIATGVGNMSYWNWQGPPQSEVFKINVLRMRAFQTNYLPSDTVSATYIVSPDANTRYDLPVVSIMADYDALFDPEIGILVPGTGHGGNFLNYNYNQRGPEWEREAHIEFFENRTLGFAQDVGIRIHGGFSRNAPIKSLRVYARERYGEGAINYPIFPDKTNEVFERLILHSGASDWAMVAWRDAFAQSLARETTEVTTQHYRPTILFINGEFWGIHAFRDRYDDSFLEHEFGVHDADMLTEISTVDRGSNADYLTLYKRLRDENSNDSAFYSWIKENMDVENFRDYHIAQIYYMNVDQPGKNADFWRSQSVRTGHPYADKRWRWLLYDVDNSYGFNTTYAQPTRNGLIYSTSLNRIDSTTVNPKSTSPSYAPNTPEATLPLRRMLMNDAFRADFINRFADLLNTAFSSDYATARAEEFEQEVEPYIAEHIIRWRQPVNVAKWRELGDRVITFADERPANMRSHLREFFRLGAPTTITLDVEGPAGSGFIQVNSLDLLESTPGVDADPYPWSGVYFAGLPVRVRAVRFPGYVFSKWKEQPDTQSDVVTISPTSDLRLTAQFRVAPPEELLHYWSFNNLASLTEATYTIGGAEMTIEHSPSSASAFDTGQGFTGLNARAEASAGHHLRINKPNDAFLSIAAPTTGFEQPVIRYETRRSRQGAAIQYLSITTDGITYEPIASILVNDASPVVHTIDLRGYEGVENNPDLGIRIFFDRGTGGDEGNVRIDNLSIDAIPLGGYAVWAVRHFNAEQRNDPSIGGQYGSPAGDGVPNLLKYALDYDPWTALHASPLGIVHSAGSPSGLALRFQPNPDATDVAFHIEVTDTSDQSLTAWEQIFLSEGVPETENGFVLIPITQEHLETPHFFRLRISP